MTKDDVIRMAREAGWDMDDNLTDIFGFGVRLERFANLVAAAEREACETAVEDIARQYQKAHEASAENVADACAYAIRARGNT
jgi:hypothetical protein